MRSIVGAVAKPPSTIALPHHQSNRICAALLVVSHKDEQGRATVFEHLPRDLPRVISVGRLDLDSEGLLLLTTSGALARAMELPSNALARVYRARIRGLPMETHFEQLERGVRVGDVQYEPIDVTVERSKEGRNQWLRLTLREGKNREIRRIFEHFDLPVSRLIRIQYGNFHLDDLAPEEVAEVPTADVMKLMENSGCHCTPRQKGWAGYSMPSITPSPARALTMTPSAVLATA